MNLDAILEFLKLAPRQQTAFYALVDAFKGLTGEMSVQKLVASFMVIVEMLGCVLFDTPVTPRGEKLDISGYELVFCDDFDGDSLDYTVWKHRGEGARRNGFNASSQAEVKDGELTLTAEYLTDGMYGEGWYSGMISLRKLYKQGYYEIRCKCNADDEFWSAFWIQAIEGPYDHDISRGGVGGAEIDIFEAMSYDATLKSNRNAVTSTVHCNGVDDDIENIDSLCVGEFKVGKDIYNEYNTYGVKWTEDEYIFYINGVESGRTSFGKGTSQVPEEVIVSLEIPNEITHDTDFTTKMVVDYVKIYQ